MMHLRDRQLLYSAVVNFVLERRSNLNLKIGKKENYSVDGG